MKSTWIDRLFVIWIAAALTLWAAALAVLWAERFDPSGTALVSALAAMLLALAASARLPGKAAVALQRVLVAMKLRDSRAMALATAAWTPLRPQDAPALMRLLAVSAVLTVAGGLASTAAAWLAPALEGALARRMVLGPAGWWVFRLLVEFAGSLPLASGMALTFLVTVLVRGGSGRDHYASVFREWLAGLAAGFALAAAAWWLGADLLGVALVAAVSIMAAALLAVQRVKLTIRPRRVMRPVEDGGQRWRRAGVAAGFGGVAVALAAQARVLRDVAGAGPAAQACWVAGSIALLAWQLRAADRRSRPPGDAQMAGAAVGSFCGLVLQGVLAGRCLAGGAEAAFCGLLGAAAQVPLAALAALTISRQRRLFATAGGRPREYVVLASIGAGGGLLCLLAAGRLGVLGVAGLGLAVVGAVAGVVRGISTARRADRQVQWAAVGALLIGAAGLAGVRVFRSLPFLSGGAWLTTASARHGAVPQRVGWAMGPCRWRSRAVTDAEAALLRQRPGRWWLAASAPEDVQALEFALAGARWSVPDPTAARWSVRRGDLPPRGALPFDAVRDRSWFDGILLAPLPADHPEAWRCFAPNVLRGCVRKLLPGGTIALRTQAGPGRVGDALCVARAFADMAGGGWAVVAVSDAGLDMLLIGPGPPPAAPTSGAAKVQALEKLLGWAPGARASRLSGRGTPFGPRPSLRRLGEMLEAVDAAP